MVNTFNCCKKQNSLVYILVVLLVMGVIDQLYIPQVNHQEFSFERTEDDLEIETQSASDIYTVRSGRISENTSHEIKRWDCRNLCMLSSIAAANQKTPIEKTKLLGEFLLPERMDVTFDDILRDNSAVTIEGAWAPPMKRFEECLDVNPAGVGIVIPFRKRSTQLRILLSYLIPVLRRQSICYQIMVIRHFGDRIFNKGILINAGALEMSRRFHFECFIMHDVDWAPINDYNTYACDGIAKRAPVHMGYASDQRGFKLFYKGSFGGVLKFFLPHFLAVNGYSNQYWGWGQEDDDMYSRVKAEKLNFTRPSTRFARYKEIPHYRCKRPTASAARLKLLSRAAQRYKSDGLNSVNYTVLSTSKTSLFSLIDIDVGQPPIDLNGTYPILQEC